MRLKAPGKIPRLTLRGARLGLNLVAGGLFIEACHRFPSLSGIESRHLNDYAAFNYWVKDLVTSMNTRLSIKGAPIMEHGLFVSNHISWLDTIILNHAKPLSFIARHDLVEWPFIGTFTQRMASVYINRSNKFHAYRSLPRIEERLNEGRSVSVFPESTTSDGRSVLPFYPMFYEAAVRCGLPVQPVAIRYFDASGKPSVDPAFIGEDSFAETLERIFLMDKVYAELTFLEPLDSRIHDRKALCRLSRERIVECVEGSCGNEAS